MLLQNVLSSYRMSIFCLLLGILYVYALDLRTIYTFYVFLTVPVVWLSDVVSNDYHAVVIYGKDRGNMPPGLVLR